MNKSILLENFLNWKYKKFNRKNPSSWLENTTLQNLYNNTSGPWNSPDPVECFMLYEIAKNCDNDIIEFGSWRGRSSCFLAKGIEDSANTNRKLHCIDWFKGDNTGGAGACYNTMMKSLKLFKLNKYVKIYNHNMLTINYEQLLNNIKIDFVFYDSDHATEPTVSVLSTIHPFIEDDSILCLHDAGWEKQRLAISRLAESYKESKLIDVWEGFSILQKINKL